MKFLLILLICFDLVNSFPDCNYDILIHSDVIPTSSRFVFENISAVTPSFVELGSSYNSNGQLGLRARIGTACSYDHKLIRGELNFPSPVCVGSMAMAQYNTIGTGNTETYESGLISFDTCLIRSAGNQLSFYVSGKYCVSDSEDASQTYTRCQLSISWGIGSEGVQLVQSSNLSVIADVDNINTIVNQTQDVVEILRNDTSTIIGDLNSLLTRMGLPNNYVCGVKNHDKSLNLLSIILVSAVIILSISVIWLIRKVQVQHVDHIQIMDDAPIEMVNVHDLPHVVTHTQTGETGRI
jgi:hypothetical protein